MNKGRKEVSAHRGVSNEGKERKKGQKDEHTNQESKVGKKIILDKFSIFMGGK